LNIGAHEWVLACILLLVVLLILRALYHRSKDRHSKFYLDDLLIGDDDRASKPAIVMFGSFVLTSWVVVFQTLNKTLTDLTFAAYVSAWVVPAVARILTPQKTNGDDHVGTDKSGA
jgi:hypothetical protein